MLTFMDSKLPHDWQMSEKKSHIFQNRKSYEISSTDIYIGEYLEFIIHVFYWCIPLDHEIYTKCKKKTSNLIEVISAYNICSGIKSQQAKKTISHSVPKTFDFSQNSSVPFHQVTFYYSISYVLLIDKPNESCKDSIKFERNALSTTKKAFKKKTKKYYTSKDKYPNFTNFFRTSKSNNSNLSNGKQRT